MEPSRGYIPNAPENDLLAAMIADALPIGEFTPDDIKKATLAAMLRLAAASRVLDGEIDVNEGAPVDGEALAAVRLFRGEIRGEAE